jgi:cation transport ATPase
MRLRGVAGCVETLERAAAAESGSDDPIGRAIVDGARARGRETPSVSDVRTTTHPGARARVDGVEVVVGPRASLIAEGFEVPPSVDRFARAWEAEGHVVMHVGWGGLAAGVIAVGASADDGYG